MMERLTEKYRNADGSGISKRSLIDRPGKGYPSARALQIVTKLAEYEDLEDKGLLKVLPCGIGADIYYVPSNVNFKFNVINHHKENNRVYHQKVNNITYTKNGWYLECDKDIEYGTGGIFSDRMFKETWFLTPKEAEQKLKEMECK